MWMDGMGKDMGRHPPCTEVSDLLGMGVGGMADAMRGCDAVVSCLGHRLTLEGIYGGDGPFAHLQAYPEGSP